MVEPQTTPPIGRAADVVQPGSALPPFLAGVLARASLFSQSLPGTVEGSDILPTGPAALDVAADLAVGPTGARPRSGRAAALLASPDLPPGPDPTFALDLFHDLALSCGHDEVGLV